MKRHPTNTKPHGGNRGAGIERKGNPAYLASLSALYGSAKPARIRDNWRKRLPDPAAYYGQHVAKLGRPNGTGWAQGVCPFHDDHNKSLSVCMTGERGGWRCFSTCGGGDLVGFHMRLRGLDFRAAVRDLLGGGA
ncbi:MAG TPA: CHC2 zinc finger domain-containing protein [Rhodanobacter sp.]